MIDTKINNRYLIKEKLGEGSMGTVFIAEDMLNSNKTIALKMINRDIINKDFTASFKNEFEIMCRLKHPNLVQVYDFGKSTNSDGISNYYITMDLVKGTSLRELIKSNSHFPADKAAGIMVQLLRTLDFIHTRNILHRDIKPGNIIIIDKSKQIKLMDFGLADLGKNNKKTKGTLTYMAPEVLKNRDADKKTDIYAAGITFLEMLTGEVFNSDIDSNSHLNEVSRTLEDVSEFVKYFNPILEKIENEVLRKIVSGMINYNRKDRYSFGSEIIADLNNVFDKDYLEETEETKKAYAIGSAFIDRETEFQICTGYLDSNENCVVAVSGSTGIGKTKFLNELKKYSQLHDYTVIETKCPEKLNKNFYPFSDFINQILYSADGKLIDKYSGHLKKLLPNNDLLSEVKIIPPQDPKTENSILKETAANFIADFSQESESKNVLIINDFQFADKSSQDALYELTAKMSQKEKRNLRIFIGIRNEEGKNIDSLIKRLEEQKRFKEIELQPFLDTDVINYIESLFGNENLSSDIYSAIPKILEETKGIPLYIQNVVKSFIDYGYLEKEKNKWSLTKPVSEIKISNNIKELAYERIKNLKLSEKEKYVFETAALLRRDTTADELYKITDCGIDIAGFLTDLVKEEILVSERTAENIVFYFAHEMIRDAAEENIVNKIEIHKKIAEKIEEIYQEEIDNYIDELAYHYGFTNLNEKKKIYFEKAGDKAKESYSNDKAIMYYGKLLNILDEADYERKAEVCIKKGSLLDIIGMWDESRTILEKAKETASKHNLKHIELTADRFLGTYYIKKGDYKKAETILNRVLEEQKALEEETELLTVLNHLGTLARRVGDFTKARKYYEEELHLAEKLDNKLEISIAVGNLGTVYQEQDKALECYEKQLKIAEELNNKKMVNQALNRVGCALWVKSEYDKALMHFERLLKSGEECGDKRAVNVAVGNMGNVYVHLRQYEKALEFYFKKLTVAEELGYKRGVAIARGNIGEVYSSVGNYDKAMDNYHKQLEIAEEIGDKQAVSICVGNLGSLEYKLGNYSKAMHYFRKKLKISEEINDKRGLCTANGNIGELYKNMNDLEKSEMYLEKSIILAREYNIKKLLSMFLYDKADLHFILKKYNESESLNKEALKIAEEIHLEEIIFKSNLLKSKLEFVNPEGNKNEAVRRLKNLLKQFTQEDEQAHAYYTLYKLTNADEFLIKSKNMYEELLRRVPDYYYREKLIELQTDYSERFSQDNNFNSVAVISERIEKKSETEEVYSDKYKINYFTKLLEIIYKLNSDMPLNESLKFIIDFIIDFIKADRGFILLYNQKGKLEVEVARDNEEQDLKEKEYKISQTAVEKVLITGRPFFDPNISDDPLMFADSIIDMNVHSIMCVPLGKRIFTGRGSEKRKYNAPTSSQILGLIYVDSRHTTAKSRFSGDNLMLLQAIAEQASEAIINAILYKSINIDELTGLYLRSYFENVLKNELRLGMHLDSKISLMMVDVDDFKKIKNEYGYKTGEKILQCFGDLFKNNLRQADVCSRYGIDEFALILPNTNTEQSLLVAEKVLEKVSKYDFPIEKVTVSIGLSSFPDDMRIAMKDDVSGTALDSSLIAENLIKFSDQALHSAKEKGKNCFVHWNFELMKTATKPNVTDILVGDPVRDYRNVQMLLEAISVSNSTLELNTLLERIMDMIIEITESERGMLMILNEKTDELKIRIARTRKGEDIGDIMSYSKSVPQKVFSTGKPVTVKDISESGATMSMMNFDIRSVMCSPLQVKEKRFGVIYVDSHSAVREFSRADLSFFFAMSSQVADAVENARLHEETVKMADIIQKTNKSLAKRELELLQSNKENELLKNYLSNIIESMPSMLVALDGHGKINRWNSAAEKYTGIDKEEAIDRIFWDAAPDFTKYRKAFYEVIETGTPREFMREQIKNSLETKYYNIAIYPVVTKRIVGIVIRVDDITEIERKEEQLRQAQKMEIIGTLAGGLAHDFNNTLGGIVGMLSLIQYKLTASPEIKRKELLGLFDTMMLSADRAANMVQQLLTLSRQHELTLVPVDLNYTIKHVLKLCRNTFDKRITIVDNPADAEALVNGDPAQLEQMLLNLSINASHALTIMRKNESDQGGKLFIALEKIYADKYFCEAHPEAEERYYWNLSVRDTGIGMDKQTISKIFTPFYTTKPAGTGTGLGLAMVYNIVKQHQGFIDVYSEIDIGTTFNIYLPLLESKDDLEKTDRDIIDVPTGEGLILIVDDDEIMRLTAKSMLETCGYETIFASDGEEGVRVFMENKDRIDLVLLDMIMPKMHGQDAYKIMKKSAGGIKFIVISGFAKDEKIDELMELGIDAFIKKPYTLRKIAKGVHKVLKGSDPMIID